MTYRTPAAHCHNDCQVPVDWSPYCLLLRFILHWRRAPHLSHVKGRLFKRLDIPGKFIYVFLYFSPAAGATVGAVVGTVGNVYW